VCGRKALFYSGIFVVVASFVFYVLSNAQFYTVSVRTFVIPFYRGSGSGSDLEP
jgi:hypothetical protein